MYRECASNEEVRLICEMSADASQKSLELIRDIDITVSALAWIESQTRPTVEFVNKQITAIKQCTRTTKIDPDCLASKSSFEAEESSARLYALLLDKRASAVNASELNGDDEEAVVDAYNLAIAAMADVHNTFADLRWAIGEHDADLEEPTGKPLSTTEEISEYLDGL